MGADEPQGPGWWIASDGKWYPPELHPDRVARPTPPVPSSMHVVASTVAAETTTNGPDPMAVELVRAETIVTETVTESAAGGADAAATTTVTVAAIAERTVRTVPKWESDARDSIATALRRYAKPLSDLVARDANEGDTRLFVTDFLCDALGFDKYEELTTEYAVKGEFADYGVRIDKQLVAFIEVKRCTTKLNERHLRQVQSYAVNEGVEWLILTNGQTWQVWHLTGGLPVAMDLVFSVDLLGAGSASVKVDELFHLSKPAMKRQTIAALWLTKKATSPASIARAVLSPFVLDAIRKEVRRQTEHNAAVAEIEDVLRTAVLRPDCV